MPREIPIGTKFIFAAETIEFDRPVIEAADSEGDAAPKRRTFAMRAYSGGKMNLGWGAPVVVNLAKTAVAAQQIPILLQHGNLGYDRTILDAVLGHSTEITIDRKIAAKGEISGASEDAKLAVQLNDNGFPFQASIGARIEEYRYVDAGESIELNGKTWKGPLYAVLASTLVEISFVVMGADSSTNARIAAEAAQEGTMSRFTPAAAAAIAAATLASSTNPAADSVAAADPASSTPSGSPANAPPQTAATLAAAASNTTPSNDAPLRFADAQSLIAGMQSNMLATLNARAAEIARIEQLTAGHPDIRAKALAGGWNAKDTELEVLRAERPSAPGVVIFGGSSQPMSDLVMEASLAAATNYMNPERLAKHYDAPTVEAAMKARRNGFSLGELLVRAAAAQGVRVSRITAANIKQVLEAAFSNVAVPTALSNVANKVAVDAFMAVEQSWRPIAKVSQTRDFKPYTTFRLNSDFKFKQVAPTGELQNGEVGESTYQNRARTAGIMATVTREEIINDDLRALSALPEHLGRGGALALLESFWTAFMNNAAFFTAGRGNFISGASTALGIDSLTQAYTALLDMKDERGNPMAFTGQPLLLVPNGLFITAKQIYASSNIVAVTGTMSPEANPHAGSFEPVKSSYLNNPNFAGNSTKAWYLIQPPTSAGGVIDVAFLDGVQVPTIEQVELDPSVLGFGYRGYFDWGVALMEHRFGVKSKGEA